MTRMFARPVSILNINQFLWNFANQHSCVIHIEQHTEPVPVLLAFSVIWCINTGNIFCMELFLSTGKSKNRIAHLYPLADSFCMQSSHTTFYLEVCKMCVRASEPSIFNHACNSNPLRGHWISVYLDKLEPQGALIAHLSTMSTPVKS